MLLSQHSQGLLQDSPMVDLLPQKACGWMLEKVGLEAD